MTLRTKSRRGQWLAWVCTALVALAAYVILSRLLCGTASLEFFDPSRYRLALPILIVFAFIAWEMRWDGVVREEEGRGKKWQEVRSEREEVRSEREEVRSKRDEVRSKRDEVRSKHEEVRSEREEVRSVREEAGDVKGEDEGEALYIQARAMPHQEIPDIVVDREYLELLGKAVQAGYPRAMVKLGEYAMRRCAWVEAYYWMSMAKRHGVQKLMSVMREIRHQWALCGHPDESENIYGLFDEDCGSVGRALLNIAAGRDVTAARDFLKTNHPEIDC